MKWIRYYNKKKPDGKEEEDPNFKRSMEDPIEALKNNEKLRNAFLKKQKELGLNILDLNTDPSEDAHTTDISKIELNSKIHIAMNNNNGRVNKIGKQVNMRELEKLKRVIDLTGKHCLYVSCFDEGDKQRIVNDLTNMIVSMLTDCLAYSEEIENPVPVCITNESIFETGPITKILEEESSKVDPNQHDFDFLNHLNRVELISLFKELCDDKNIYAKLLDKVSSLGKGPQHGKSQSKRSRKNRKKSGKMK